MHINGLSVTSFQCILTLHFIIRWSIACKRFGTYNYNPLLLHTYLDHNNMYSIFFGGSYGLGDSLRASQLGVGLHLPVG